MTYRVPKLLVTSRLRGREPEFKARRRETTDPCPFLNLDDTEPQCEVLGPGHEGVCYLLAPTQAHRQVNSYRECSLVSVVDQALEIGVEHARKLYLIEEADREYERLEPPMIETPGKRGCF